jgi:DNA-binding winged helix-turn-helix (wHTH) protein
MLIRFGACTFDAVRRELRRGEDAAHLSPHAFELLSRLVAARPHALSKEELLSSMWPEDFVTESSLAGLVAEIRRTIGDDAREPRFLRTVHGYGYALSDGEPREADEDAVCRIVWGPREVSLAEGENLVGRDPAASISVDDPRVSRHHARIVVAGGAARLEDLGSKNGTWLGERRIESPEPLSDGDEIRVGPARLVFRSFRACGPTQTALD